MSPEEKKRLTKAKNNHTLHVALIMRDEVSKADALVVAYSEGQSGLNARLNVTGAAK